MNKDIYNKIISLYLFICYIKKSFLSITFFELIIDNCYVVYLINFISWCLNNVLIITLKYLRIYKVQRKIYITKLHKRISSSYDDNNFCPRGASENSRLISFF